MDRTDPRMSLPIGSRPTGSAEPLAKPVSPESAAPATDDRPEEQPPTDVSPAAAFVSGLRAPSAANLDGEAIDRTIAAVDRRLGTARAPLPAGEEATAEAIILNAAMIPGYPPPPPLAMPGGRSRRRPRRSPSDTTNAEPEDPAGDVATGPIAAMRRKTAMLLRMMALATGFAGAMRIALSELLAMRQEKKLLHGRDTDDADGRRRRLWLR